MDFSENLSQLGGSESDVSVPNEQAAPSKRLGVVGLLFRTLWDAIRRLFNRTDSAKTDRKET